VYKKVIDHVLFVWAGVIPSPKNYSMDLVEFKTRIEYEEIKIEVWYQGKRLFYYFNHDTKDIEKASDLNVWDEEFLYRRRRRIIDNFIEGKEECPLNPSY